MLHFTLAIISTYTVPIACVCENMKYEITYVPSNSDL